MASLLSHVGDTLAAALLQARGIAPLLDLPATRCSLHQEQDHENNVVRVPKRQRDETQALAGDDDEEDVKPDIVDSSDEGEDELSVLKGQLSQMMERIDKMARKKKRRKMSKAKRVKKEEPVAESSSRLCLVQGETIDLTLSD
ncbi:hypothetical protein BD309DRAFT_876088 [Dichomitus squalens]|uniref:Uncharacterized protein n=1 Tax=Dichomitus squalens TaxID=114155 RepID=A0A4Q9NBA5_9APHY|nr:hypothetical protein BD309DRAFT_876088 [Dichomitus squalens]TBU59462.1 hypothetical protein BD310DRAFT_817358 [Dichomitus squalens]